MGFCVLSLLSREEALQGRAKESSFGGVRGCFRIAADQEVNDDEAKTRVEWNVIRFHEADGICELVLFFALPRN